MKPVSDLEILLDKLEDMGFWSIEFIKRSIWNSDKHQLVEGYDIQWGHNRISWVDMPKIWGNTREEGLKSLIRKAEKLLATDHTFGQGRGWMNSPKPKITEN